MEGLISAGVGGGRGYERNKNNVSKRASAVLIEISF